jgi:hypothetical protein
MTPFDAIVDLLWIIIYGLVLNFAVYGMGFIVGCWKQFFH